MSLAVRMAGISKRFGDVQALADVDLDVEAKTIHAIVGENGAGKTTLMRALYGAMRPDSGRIEIDGEVVRFQRSAQAIAAGIGMVSQHYGIIPDLTCLQNLILGAEGAATIPVKLRRERAEQLAAQMGFEFDWDADAATLSPAGAQKLEILKLLWRDAKVMILDEPTAMLSPADADALFESLQRLVGEGRTVLLVTHRLPEVLDYCSRVTVLRAGRLVADMPVAETTSAQLASLIVGGDVILPRQRDYELGESAVLSVHDLVVKGSRGNDAVKGASFLVRRGEVVGVAGVDGNGQRELFEALLAIVPVQKGGISLNGCNASSLDAAGRISAGVRIIPEDRHAEAVVESWSLEQNAVLGLQRLAPFARGSVVVPSARTAAAERIADRFHTKRGALSDPISSLSGGNQQRFVAARALENDPKLILAFQPARGLDINAAQRVYEGIRQTCRAGAGALIVSFDLDELLEHCDRIIVLNGGVLSEPPAGEAMDRQAIGKLMVGAA